MIWTLCPVWPLTLLSEQRACLLSPVFLEKKNEKTPKTSQSYHSCILKHVFLYPVKNRADRKTQPEPADCVPKSEKICGLGTLTFSSHLQKQTIFFSLLENRKHLTSLLGQNNVSTWNDSDIYFKNHVSVKTVLSLYFPSFPSSNLTFIHYILLQYTV